MNIKNKFDRRTAVYLVLGILIGSALTISLTGDILTNNEQSSAKNLVSTLEKSTGQDLELVKVDEQNGMYRAQIKNSEDQLSTYYISKNGEIVVEESDVTYLKNFSQRVDALAEFTDCLAEKNVTMYGNLSQRETVAQVQLLGGTNQVSDIYSSLNQRQNLAEAVQRGVQRVPAFYYENSTIQGVQSVENLEEFTGCSYSKEN